MRKRWIFIAPAILLGMALLVFVGGEVVRLLWNWLLPSLFGWPPIAFWQALGLLALCRILFGGFGIHGRHRPGRGFRGRMADRMAERVAERWEHMTAEEREEFRRRVRERCGFDVRASEGSGR